MDARKRTMVLYDEVVAEKYVSVVEDIYRREVLTCSCCSLYVHYYHFCLHTYISE